MPEFNPRAIDPGLFFKSLSADCLHMAHCASAELKAKINKSKTMNVNMILRFGTIGQTFCNLQE